MVLEDSYVYFSFYVPDYLVLVFSFSLNCILENYDVSTAGFVICKVGTFVLSILSICCFHELVLFCSDLHVDLLPKYTDMVKDFKFCVLVPCDFELVFT